MTATLTGAFVLPDDILLVGVDELSDAMRARLSCAEGDVAITRPRARKPSSIVDAQAARLIALFREPSSVTDAVIAFSRAGDLDPRVVLERAFPMIERLVLEDILVPVGSSRAGPIDGPLRAGDRIGAFEIIDLVQLLEDVEVHRVRTTAGGFGALKIARNGYADRLRTSLMNELRVLRALDGTGVPVVLDADLSADRPYVVLEWCRGVPPLRAADEFRGTGDPDARRGLRELCVDIASAYARLHARGMLHGDVHDRNVLVNGRGEVTLLDFGLSVVTDGTNVEAAPRGGVPGYYDPDLAAAYREETDARPLDSATEQYSLAALLYNVAAGGPYLALSARKDEALRQIIEDPPRSFEVCGGRAWDAMEHVLRRGLSKRATDRFASVAELVEAIRGVDVGDEPGTSHTAVRMTERTRFVEAAFARVAPGGSLFRDGLPIAPHVSINNGAAGIAYAWYRVAAANNSATMLANADAWALRAREWCARPEAFYSADKSITRGGVGPVALYHTATGVSCVDAIIALALGDERRAEASGASFAKESMVRTRLIDLTLGQAGVLLGGVLMLESSPRRLADVHARCGVVAQRLERVLAGFGPVRDEKRMVFTGIAHGWAGLLYALLRWRRAAGLEPSPMLHDRLDELAAIAAPRGRGVAWSFKIDAHPDGIPPAPVPTWCNGTAGHVFLWILAHEIYREPRYAALADAAAWNVWDDSRDAMADPCCGLAGRAYALMGIHRATSDAAWRRRAEILADRAMRHSATDQSSSHRLYKGALGVAVLVEELLKAPEWARMPLFEPEGFAWR